MKKIVRSKRSRADTWKFYRDSKGFYQWRRLAPNGKIVGASSEGYASLAGMAANARRNGYLGDKVSISSAG